MRRREHPMLPAHSHFHTCESIGESSDDPLVENDDHVFVYDPCVVNDHQQHMRPNPFVKTEFGAEMITCQIMLMDIGDKHSNEL